MVGELFGMSVSFSLSPSLAPKEHSYLVGEEFPQHQQAVATSGGNGHSDLHHHPMDGEKAQILHLQPEESQHMAVEG